MSFEILDKDLAGRIGKLMTKSGVIETPALFPVINPVKQVVPLSEIRSIGFNQVITNAYLLKRHYGDLVRDVGGIHRFLNWDGPIMTDSGAYQLLMYGKIEVSPRDILKYEVDIGTDIGVILDIPTQWGRPRDAVLLEVEETLRRARAALTEIRLWDPEHRMLIVGPIQGGDKLDILSYSASRMSELNFDIYAIGSPTTLLEEYDFATIVSMIVTVKARIPPGKPVHLFGAGHPLILPFAVALGVDLFDSASYVLYARDDRVILRDRTVRLNELKIDRLPCNCPVCRKYSVSELMSMSKPERERLLAIHNLYVLWEELQEIKARIKEGTLWEYLEEKAGGDARVKSALLALKKGLKALLRLVPDRAGRVRAMHVTSIESLGRPEVIRHIERLLNNYEPPKGCVVVVLPGEYLERPYARDPLITLFLNELVRKDLLGKVHLVINNPVLGPIPYEISEVYPLSQHEYPKPVHRYLRQLSLRILRKYLTMLAQRGFTDLVIIVPSGHESEVGSIIKRVGGFRNYVMLNAGSRAELALLMGWIVNLISGMECPA
jgi:7-cyano-7-deazaguanine tRNA-ribosyltransferase